MVTRLAKHLVVLSLVTLAGCKLTAVVTPGGDVQSSSGTNDCAGGQVCALDLSAGFNDTFTATARQGYKFVKWQNGTGNDKGGFLCGDSTNPTCTLSLPNDANGEAIAALKSIGYIMPVFCVDTDGDLTCNSADTDDDDDGILDADDHCPLAGPSEDGFGCPSTLDTDNDGIRDTVDPDDDNDGVLDDADQCPLLGPNLDGYGCPDTDGDGIMDVDDPDDDNDAVLDADDHCPLVGPNDDGYGCPDLTDTDGDGVVDRDDTDDDNDGVLDDYDWCRLEGPNADGHGCPPRPIVDTKVISDGAEYANPDRFQGVTYADVAAACSSGTCSGVLGGWIVDGWKWASETEVLQFYQYLTGITCAPHCHFSQTVYIYYDGANPPWCFLCGSPSTTVALFNMGSSWSLRLLEGYTAGGGGQGAKFTNAQDSNPSTQTFIIDESFESLTAVAGGVWLYRSPAGG